MIEEKNCIYDMLININSIMGIKKGWDIHYSSKGKEKIENAKKNPTKIVSFLGNKNRGKNFIFSKITKINIPFENRILSKGLKIFFLDNIDNIALVNGYSLDNPLLENDNGDYLLKSQDENEAKKIYDKLNELNIEIKNLKKEKQNITIIKDKENEFFRIKKEYRKSLYDKDEQIISLTNERIFTNYFLQNFIIENTHILLLVIGKLTKNEQILIMKLKKLIKENNYEILQKIIIIHNLQNIKNIDNIEKYIENTLRKSLTFTLKKEKDLFLEEKEKNKKKYNKYRYIEVNQDLINIEITHLIMAQEGTEAGNYYNESTIEYIKGTYISIKNAKPFNIIEKLKEYFCKIGEKIIKFQTLNDKIKPDDILRIKKNEENEKLILNNKNDIILDYFSYDIFNLFRETKFTPKYYIISDDPEYVKIYLDCPGIIKINNIDIKFPSKQIIKVIILGEREIHKLNNKVYGRKFGYGKFDLEIILKQEEENIKTKEIKITSIGNGFYLIKLERINKNNNI